MLEKSTGSSDVGSMLPLSTGSSTHQYDFTFLEGDVGHYVSSSCWAIKLSASTDFQFFISTSKKQLTIYHCKFCRVSAI